MNPKPPRRWFRFSLRAMFVAVTALCIWLGVTANWLRARQEFRQRERVHLLRNSSPLQSPPAAPGLLWIFGEEGFGYVFVPNNGPLHDEARRLFPEAYYVGDGHKMAEPLTR